MYTYLTNIPSFILTNLSAWEYGEMRILRNKNTPNNPLKQKFDKFIVDL